MKRYAISTADYYIIYTTPITKIKCYIRVAAPCDNETLKGQPQSHVILLLLATRKVCYVYCS